MALEIGKSAPDFKMKISEEKYISLTDLKGKNVIIYFYPKDDTPGCTIEAQDFNKLKAEFDRLNTVIIGISKDDTKSHTKFKDKYCLEFDLATDDTKICENYGLWVEKSMYGKKYWGIERTTILIDTNGLIAHIWNKVNPNGHAAEVLQTVKDKS